MSWLKYLSGRNLIRIAQMTPQEMATYFATLFDLDGYNTEFAFVDASGRPISEEIAKQKMAETIVETGPKAINGFVQMIAKTLELGRPLTISVSFSDGEPNVQILGTMLPPPLVESTLSNKGAFIQDMMSSRQQVERQRARERHITQRTDALDTMNADDLLLEANRVAYLLARTRVERDIPRHKKEKYDTSYHFTISAGGGASIEELCDLLPPAALQGANIGPTSIRVTNKAAVAALLDELGLTTHIPLIRGKIGEESEIIPLSQYAPVVFNDFRRRAIAKQMSEADLKEYWDLGLQGTFFARQH